MTRRTNFTNERPTSRDSCQTPNYANLVPQNPLQVAAQPQPTFVYAFRQNLEIDPLDPDQTISTPEEVQPNAITSARTLLAGLSGQETSQIDFYAEQPSEEQVIEARQRARAATDLVTRRKLLKHNNPSAQPMLAFDQILADLETKLLQQYRLLQGTLTQIVKRDWITTLKHNFCAFISTYDTIYKVNMTRSLMDTTEQGNLLKTQPSPVIRPGYNNQMLRSLRALPQTEGAHPASVDTLLTRIVGFTEELDQELKILTAQQVIDMIRSKPEIIPPECAQDLVRKPTPETQLTAFLPLLSQLQQQSLNPYAPLNPFYNQLPQQQVQGQQPPQYPFQYSGQPMQYPMQPVQFPVIQPPNPFLPTMNPPQTQMSEPRLPSNETVREQQGPIQPGQQMEQATTQTVERPRQSTTSVRSVHNMLITQISAYPQQQTPRIPLLPYTTEKNHQQRQSWRSISPTHMGAEESEDDEFLDAIIPGMTMPHLPPHMSDIESAQRIWQNRGYDLVRDTSVIKYKNSKWHSKLATQKPFIFRDWREFWSDAGFSLEQINIPHYMSKEYKSQNPHEKSRRNESIRIYERERQYAIDNGKGLKRSRIDETLLEAEAKKKQSSNSSSSSSSSSSNSSNNQEIEEDWTGKGNQVVP
ncbi:MAG: hypothetical protein EZS28_019921 [Streblomastix strix]|uniref:Uncharacterized protein n=1 Tax=Streblomastix strix TaxID=222440 RepID=A0A5J4VPZ6_9EUKA|nr:MAG: hypothetical protein EZS28_019921 [Streblomastix strix]